MPLPSEQVLAIAHLARLEIKPDEVARHADELTGILDLIDQLSAVDVNGIDPLAHPLEMVQRLRPDVVTEGDERETLLAAAPLSERGLFLVPKVIE